jgi:hypothetical protein
MNLPLFISNINCRDLDILYHYLLQKAFLGDFMQFYKSAAYRPLVEFRVLI